MLLSQETDTKTILNPGASTQNCMTWLLFWLLSLSDHWGGKVLSLYIFWMPTHSSFQHPTNAILSRWFIWHFYCSLFTLRHSCTSCFWNPHWLTCQWSICNIPHYPIFQNFRLWGFSLYPSPTFSTYNLPKIQKKQQKKKTIIIQTFKGYLFIMQFLLVLVIT